MNWPACCTRISHVSARHIEARLSQEQLAQFGLILGSIVAGPAASQTYGGLVQLGTQLLFTKYSREQESQADLLGTAYMTEAGFNPEGARNMLLALKRLDSGKDTTGVDRYFIDHPDPAKRVQDVESKIATIEKNAPAAVQQPMDRNSFIRQLQGMIVGDSTMQTTITDNTIYQRRYGMIVPIPPAGRTWFPLVHSSPWRRKETKRGRRSSPRICRSRSCREQAPYRMEFGHFSSRWDCSL